MEHINHGRPPLAGWLGGKSKLAKLIVERLPPHNCYVEPFAGAAWVLFRKAESPSEIINDINRDVVNLYRVVQHHLDEFIRFFRWALVSREEFERLHNVPADTQTDIQRAARFYYLQQCGFNGRVDGRTFGCSPTRHPKLNLLRIEEQLSAAHLRLARVYVEHLPYAEAIRRFDRPDTCFYVDPPYWGCEGDYGKGCFCRADFAALAEQLQGIKGKCVVSLNDTPGVRETFAGFNFEPVRTTYTCAASNNTPASELLITNF